MKVLKYTIIGLISLFVLAAIAIGILMTIVNPNRFKPAITTAVEQATGRELDLNGNISWTIYPNLGLKIEDVALSNPKEFNDSKFLQLKSADVAVELIPLLSHKIMFKALDINGLNVALLKKGNVNNWTFTQRSPKNQTSGTPEKQDIQLSINEFSLTNSSIIFTDLDKKTTKGLKNANFKLTSGFDGGIKLDTLASTLSLRKLTLNYNDNFIGNINFDINDLDNPKYKGDIDIKTIKANALMKEFDLVSAKPMPLLDNISVKTKIDGNLDNAKLSDLAFNINKVIKGNVNLSVNNFKSPNIIGNINIKNIDINKVMTQLNMAPIEIANKNLLTNVDFKTNFNGTTKNMNLNSIVLKAHDTTARGSVNITSFTPMNIVENINIDKFDVSNISNINGFKVPLSQINISGNANLGKSGINSLSGKQNVSIGNITVLGLNLNKQIKSASALIANIGNNNLSSLDKTKLTNDINGIKTTLTNAVKPGPKNFNEKSNLGNFTMHANFNRGTANPSNFTLAGPDLSLGGNGSVNIPTKSLDYKVHGKIVTAGVDPLFAHLTLNAAVNGTFKEPSIKLDWNSLMGQLINYMLQNTGKAIKKQIDNQIKKSVDDSINKAIGNAIGNLFHKPAPAQ